MKEKIQKYAESMLEGVGEFEKKEIPIYIKEYLEFELYNNVVAFLLFLIATFVCCFLVIKFYKLGKEKDQNFFAFSFMCIFFTVLFSCASIAWGMSIIKINSAPRVYLVDELINTK